MSARPEEISVIHDGTNWMSDAYILPRDFTPREGQVVDKNALWVGKHFLRHTRLNKDVPFTVISVRPETHEMVVFYESQEGDRLTLDTVKLSEFGVGSDPDSGLMHSQNYLTVDTNPKGDRDQMIIDHDVNGQIRASQVLCLVAASEATTVRETFRYLRKLSLSLENKFGVLEDLGITLDDIEVILACAKIDANLNEYGDYDFEILCEKLINGLPSCLKEGK